MKEILKVLFLYVRLYVVCVIDWLIDWPWPPFRPSNHLSCIYYAITARVGSLFQGVADALINNASSSSRRSFINVSRTRTLRVQKWHLRRLDDIGDRSNEWMRNPTESQIDEQGEMGRECNFIMSLSAQLGEEEGWREEGGEKWRMRSNRR